MLWSVIVDDRKSKIDYDQQFDFNEFARQKNRKFRLWTEEEEEEVGGRYETTGDKQVTFLFECMAWERQQLKVKDKSALSTPLYLSVPLSRLLCRQTGWGVASHRCDPISLFNGVPKAASSRYVPKRLAIDRSIDLFISIATQFIFITLDLWGGISVERARANCKPVSRLRWKSARAKCCQAAT